MTKTKDTTDDQLIRLLLKKVGPVDMDEVIGVIDASGKNLIQLNGKRASDSEAILLQKEANMLENMRLYKILTETLRYQAHQNMFANSKVKEEVYISGKFLLHAISTLEHLVRACKNPLLLSDQKPVMRAPRRGVDKSVDSN